MGSRHRDHELLSTGYLNSIICLIPSQDFFLLLLPLLPLLSLESHGVGGVKPELSGRGCRCCRACSLTSSLLIPILKKRACGWSLLLLPFLAFSIRLSVSLNQQLQLAFANYSRHAKSILASLQQKTLFFFLHPLIFLHQQQVFFEILL